MLKIIPIVILCLMVTVNISASSNLSFSYFKADSLPSIQYSIYSINDSYKIPSYESYKANLREENIYKWSMFPVPVTDQLNLRYAGSENIKGVIHVIVQRVQGSVLYRLRYASSTKKIIIPVNNFGKGFYEVRLLVDQEVIWSGRFVK